MDGYVYLYRSVVELGNYDKKEKLEKCGNNVIYRFPRMERMRSFTNLKMKKPSIMT